MGNEFHQDIYADSRARGDGDGQQRINGRTRSVLGEQPGLHVRRASDNGVADAANVPKSAWMDDGRTGAMDRVAVLSPAVQLSGPADMSGQFHTNITSRMERIDLEFTGMYAPRSNSAV
ncbi:hypothetical protein [Paraburkholderia strydomiana]|uniref:hypothetical protein n=1 Tax=Paraburkholderia strydomiana TaxID=1245417 RepID=UPI001BE6E557|nr:hypothetical protein [Paraburkholderia strydomiana]